MKHFPPPYLKVVSQVMRQNLEEPAVVLFAYQPGGNFREEPVYNTDVAWPDDATIIRAHDLGKVRNQAIFDYYARTQPERTFYSFDRSRPPEEMLKRLGTARELGTRR